MRGSAAGLAGLWVLGMMSAVGAQLTVPPPHGAELFENRCARCHGVNADGDGGLGPSLIAVIGRPVASRHDFPYTPALRAKGGTWTPEILDDYIADPQAFAPGADMDVKSPDPAERAAIIAYLGTLR